MDNGVLTSDHTLCVRYRNAVFEEGPIIFPYDGIVLSADSSPDDLREFLVRAPPVMFPMYSTLRVSAFLLSLGMGVKEKISALRYQSAIEAVLRGGVPFLRAADEAGWDGDRFLADPVFPNVRHGVVLGCIARRCIRPELGEADRSFLRDWLWPHLIKIQDGLTAALDCQLRTELLRAVPVRYMSDRVLAGNIKTIVDEGSFDPAELRRWGKLTRALQLLVESSGRPPSAPVRGVFSRSLQYLDSHQASRVMRSCLCSGHTELCRLMAETVSVEMESQELRTVMEFVQRIVQLEELLADAVHPSIHGLP